MASLAAASNMEVMVQQQPQPSSLSLMSDTEDAAMLEESSELDDPETLDLSSHGLTKLSRAAPGYDLTTLTLLLDNNSLQRLDNIHTYQCLEKLSACNNELVRMSQVCKLNHLKILNLSNNNIEFMDGLKELKLLSWLGLANNKIKSIQQLNQCVHLEHLDLSGNFIQHLSDLSYLKNLKVLLLHRNNVETLRGCDRFFPSSVTTLTINGNDLTDLTEVSYLTGLPSMEQLTLADNPCILQPEDESKQFDYRPYVINWCLGLRVLDGVIVGAKESLKAEWMYSQSKGRHFNVGQHEDLLVYLLSVCPLHPGEDWEEDKKLNLILSKVQEHQQSLREPGSSGVLSPRNAFARTVASPMRSSSRRTSAASSASTTPTATPLAPRRSSFTFAQQQRVSGIRRSSLSRTSPSPVRRRTLTPGRLGLGLKAPPPAASYALALPRSLYGDDINGNTSNMMMTQSMDPAHLAARLDNNTTPTVLTQPCNADPLTTQELMTASLDPSMLMKGLPEAWSKEATPHLMSQQQRPNSLFETAATSTGDKSASGPNPADLKDLYLQDLSDGELASGQSMMYSRLQSRLNPVPESLNSPDTMAPVALGRPPAKDDPIRVYNRDLAVSSSTVSTTSSSRSSNAVLAPSSSNMAKSGVNSKKTEETNGYSSSSEENSSNIKKSSSNSKENNKPTKDLKSMKNPTSSLPKPASSKPRATPTKIQERRPPITNKNLNNLKKSNSVRASPENERKRTPPSDTSRLSRNASKDDGEDESSHSEAEQQKLQRVRKTRKARANSSNSSRRPSSSEVFEKKNYVAEKYSDSKSKEAGKRPLSASSRPRANTLNNGKRPENPTQRAQSAATTLQKNWRKETDKVTQLKEEVRGLRTDEHIKHLTKELASAKQALERERKLRSLQMDAIKVLWKEVQLMDEAVSDNANEVGSRPSGRGGSKISSRSSEHSIAKLMETLQATAGGNAVPPTPSPSLQSLKNQTTSVTSVDEQPQVSVSMAQSMPASMLTNQLQEMTAVEALSKTCNSLQSQVEQLQSSLMGVMQFMSNFQDAPGSQRQRHSSNESSSVSFFQMTQSVGPMSLPIQSQTQVQPHKKVTEVVKSESTSGLAMSRSCDCLTQTEISAVLTPRNEQMPPDPAAQFLRFKQVDISLETSDSEPTSVSAQQQLQERGRSLHPESGSGTRSRSKSPRPQTLPGLVKASNKTTSPPAPNQVKTYAKNLVEGILTDTITKALSDAEDNKEGQETDVSLSLATEEVPELQECENVKKIGSPSTSHVETDSLDENSEHAGQH